MLRGMVHSHITPGTTVHAFITTSLNLLPLLLLPFAVPSPYHAIHPAIIVVCSIVCLKRSLQEKASNMNQVAKSLRTSAQHKVSRADHAHDKT